MEAPAADRPSRAEVVGVLIACAIALALLARADDSGRREHDPAVSAAKTVTARTDAQPEFAPLSAKFPDR